MLAYDDISGSPVLAHDDRSGTPVLTYDDRSGTPVLAYDDGKELQRRILSEINTTNLCNPFDLF